MNDNGLWLKKKPQKVHHLASLKEALAKMLAI